MYTLVAMKPNLPFLVSADYTFTESSCCLGVMISFFYRVLPSTSHPTPTKKLIVHGLKRSCIPSSKLIQVQLCDVLPFKEGERDSWGKLKKYILAAGLRIRDQELGDVFG